MARKGPMASSESRVNRSSEPEAPPPTPTIVVAPGEDPERPKLLLINGTATPIESVAAQLAAAISSGTMSAEMARASAMQIGISATYFDELISPLIAPNPESLRPQGGKTIRRGAQQKLEDEDEDDEDIDDEDEVAITGDQVLELLPQAVYDALNRVGLNGKGVGVRLTILVDDRPEVAVGAEIIYADKSALAAFVANGTPIPPASLICASETGSVADALYDAANSAKERAAEAKDRAVRKRASSGQNTRHAR